MVLPSVCLSASTADQVIVRASHSIRTPNDILDATIQFTLRLSRNFADTGSTVVMN
jgi:hypothetical protein